MTIEEKARAYDKALNIAREILDHTSENYLCTHLTKEDIKDMYIRFFPELEESEDEKIRKSLISYLHGLGEFDYPDKKTYHDWLGWLEKQKCYVSPQMVADAYLRGCNETEEKLLEKQGKQKLQIEKLPSEMKTIGESLNFTSQEECDEYNQMVSDLIMSNSDKIELKFKVGDWITNGDYTWKIVEVKPLDYMLQSQDGNIVYDSISYVDEQFHSFTIKDIKDGDILVSYDWIFILKQFNSSGNNHKCYCHYDLTLNCFKDDTNSYMSSGSNDFKPATKEQRELLFEKMHEAGYIWNAEKRELTKIEQKKDMNNKLTDFEYSLKHIMEEAIECGDTHNLKADADMLIRLAQKHTTWSKEDEEIMSGLLSFLLINTSDQWAKYGKWILSLKERMKG